MSMTKQSSKTSSFSVRDILDLETSKAKAKETTEKIAETKPEVKPDLVQTSQSPAAKLAPAAQHLSSSATALSALLTPAFQNFHGQAAPPPVALCRLFLKIGHLRLLLILNMTCLSGLGWFYPLPLLLLSS